MLPVDTLAIQNQISQHLTRTYRETLNQQLRLYSCQKSATGPDSEAASWIETKAKADSESIARTYDRELMAQIRRIHSANKRTNRFGYMSALDTWLASRTPRKTASISLNTMTAAREYAKDRFITENGVEGKFVFTGPPPVCKLCIRIKGLGPITYKQTRLARNRLPAHLGCPHTYQQLIPKKIGCDENTWTG